MTTRDDFLPFSRPSINEQDIAAVSEVLKSGWITTGSKNAEFEKAFCDYTKIPKAVALTSATAGMHLLLKALGVGPGDEVITPSMTWVSTVNMIALTGATPVFADIEKDSLMVNADTVEKCITPRTRLIVPVHFAGASLDLDPLLSLAKKNGLFLAQDAAHALGTGYKNKKIGETGTSIFSFHPIKNITTGEGGMFCSDDAALAETIGRLKFHGLGKDAYDRNIQGRSPQAEVLEPGFKYNLPDIQAALGISQLRKIEQLNAKRRLLAERYLELFADVHEILPLSMSHDHGTHSWHLFIIRLDTDRALMDRDDFMEALKRKNIGTGLHFRAAHLHRYYREAFGFKRGMLPNTEWNSDRVCSLPLFPDMEPEDVNQVVTAIKEVLAR